MREEINTITIAEDNIVSEEEELNAVAGVFENMLEDVTFVQDNAE